MTDAEVLAASLAAARVAKRISGTSASYRKDNPLEYQKVIVYLDGGARPTGALTKMGEHLVLEEDVRRSLVVVTPPPPLGAHTWWSDASPINTPIGANPTVVYPYNLSGYTSGIGINSGGWGVGIFRDISGVRRTLTAATWVMDNVPMPPQWPAYYDAMALKGDSEKHHVIVDSDRIFNVYNASRVYTSCTAFGCLRPQTVSSGMWANNLGPWLGRSSGFCSAAGCIIKSELDAGQCNHALAAGWPSASIRNTYVSPACTSDGTGASGMPPMGSRIQLDPTLTDAQILAMGITSYWLPVVHAMQTYGAFICESTDWMTLYAESWNDNGISGLGSGGFYPASGALLQRMRIVSPPPNPIWDDTSVFGQPHH